MMIRNLRDLDKEKSLNGLTYLRGRDIATLVYMLCPNERIRNGNTYYEVCILVNKSDINGMELINKFHDKFRSSVSPSDWTGDDPSVDFNVYRIRVIYDSRSGRVAIKSGFVDPFVIPRSADIYRFAKEIRAISDSKDDMRSVHDFIDIYNIYTKYSTSKTKLAHKLFDTFKSELYSELGIHLHVSSGTIYDYMFRFKTKYFPDTKFSDIKPIVNRSLFVTQHSIPLDDLECGSMFYISRFLSPESAPKPNYVTVDDRTYFKDVKQFLEVYNDYVEFGRIDFDEFMTKLNEEYNVFIRTSPESFYRYCCKLKSKFLNKEGRLEKINDIDSFIEKNELLGDKYTFRGRLNLTKLLEVKKVG